MDKPRSLEHLSWLNTRYPQAAAWGVNAPGTGELTSLTGRTASTAEKTNLETMWAQQAEVEERQKLLEPMHQAEKAWKQRLEAGEDPKGPEMQDLEAFFAELYP